MAIHPPVQGMQELQLIIDIINDQKKLSDALKTLKDEREKLYEAIGGAQKLKNADELLKQAEFEKKMAVQSNEEAALYRSQTIQQMDEEFAAREKATHDGERALEQARNEFNAECKEKRAAMDKQLAALERRESELDRREKNVIDIQDRYTESLKNADANRKALEAALKKLGVN